MTQSSREKSLNQSHIRLADRLEDLHKTSGTWFDGTRESILERRLKISSALDDCRAQLEHYKSYQDDDYDIARIAMHLEEEREALKAIAAEYSPKEDLNNLKDLPRFSVQAAHNPYGQQELIHESAVGKSAEWEKFCAVEPYFFIEENISVLSDKKEIEHRAFSYVMERTSSLPSRSQRASIARDFVSAVEEIRSQKANS